MTADDRGSIKEIGGGKTYSQVSAEYLEDPSNQKLAQTRQTLFMGETLRGMLLNAWGWGTIGNIAALAGIVLIVIGGALLAVPLAATMLTRRREHAGAVRTVSPGAAS